jgi:hypothetical protein
MAEVLFTEPRWWLRYGYVTMPTVCGYSGEIVARTKLSQVEHNACKRCMTGNIDGGNGG